MKTQSSGDREPTQQIVRNAEAQGDNETRKWIEVHPEIKRLGKVAAKIALGVLILFAVLGVLASVAYIRLEAEAKQNPRLTYKDIQPALEAAHEVWKSLPVNRSYDPAFRDFEKKWTAFEGAIGTTDNERASPEKRIEGIEKAAKALAGSIPTVLSVLEREESELIAKMTELKGHLHELADRIGSSPEPRQRSDRILTVLGESVLNLGTAVKEILGWPLVTIIGIFLLLFYGNRVGGISGIFGGIKTLKIAGSEIVFSQAVAEEKGRTAEEIFESYRERATAELKTLSDSHYVDVRLKNVCERRIKPYLHEAVVKHLVEEKKISGPANLDPKAKKEIEKIYSEHSRSLRFTIHVEDLLFRKTLAQLVDYYPSQADPEKKAGRQWSVRYGMIGRAWRLERSYTGTEVTTDEEKLVIEWGMTRQEIRNFVSRRQSSTAVILRNPSGKPIAIFYMDANPENVFLFPEGGAERKKAIDELHTMVKDACEEFGLSQVLSQIAQSVGPRSMKIRVYGR